MLNVARLQIGKHFFKLFSQKCLNALDVALLSLCALTESILRDPHIMEICDHVELSLFDRLLDFITGILDLKLVQLMISLKSRDSV